MSKINFSGTTVVFGGISGGRPIDKDSIFEAAVERALGDTVRDSETIAIALWSSLTNQDWRHDTGEQVSYSFRAAGDLVAAIRQDGSDYLDWYCSGSAGRVSEDIAAALAKEGWRPLSPQRSAHA